MNEKASKMMRGTVLVFLTFICTTVSSPCPVKLSLSCSCEEKGSLTDVRCSTTSQQNISQPLISNTASSPPMEINLLSIKGSNITSLPANFLQGVESIVDVDFSHNLFAEVPVCLLSLENVSVVNLSYNRIDYINLTQIHAEVIDISHNIVSEIHICDVSNKWLRAVNCSYNRIKDITPGLLVVLEYLDLSFNLISDLPTVPESIIKMLSLRGNSLQSIPDKLFVGFSQLSVLDMSHNQIMHVTNKSFSGLKNLEQLELSSNQISDITGRVFREMVFLRKLSLDENKIDQLDDFTFEGLEGNLEQLGLSKNQLQTADNNTFTKLFNLRNLDLSNNVNLSYINNINFPLHLIFLNLRNCNLEQVDDCKFYESVDLQHLDLSGNNLTCSCHLSWLYIKFESKRELSQQLPAHKWTCHMTDTFKLPLGDLSFCSEESPASHHCKQAPPQLTGKAIVARLHVTSETQGILTTWEVQPAWAMQEIGSFVITFTIDGGSKMESPRLDNTKRLYIFDYKDNPSKYSICVNIFNKEDKILKSMCQVMAKENYQIFIGIMAGIVFLIPCIVAMVYILFKDRRMMIYQPIMEDVEINKSNSALEHKTDQMNSPVKCVGVKASKVCSVSENNKVRVNNTERKKGVNSDVAKTNEGYVPDGSVLKQGNSHYVSERIGDMSQIRIGIVTKL